MILGTLNLALTMHVGMYIYVHIYVKSSKCACVSHPTAPSAPVECAYDNLVGSLQRVEDCKEAVVCVILAGGSVNGLAEKGGKPMSHQLRFRFIPSVIIPLIIPALYGIMAHGDDRAKDRTQPICMASNSVSQVHIPLRKLLHMCACMPAPNL